APASDEDVLREMIDRDNRAWNEHDVDAIIAMHAPDMVFENHTAGERAEGSQVREHIARIFAAWPDIAFATRRLYVREDLVVQEWTARATHTSEMRRGEIGAAASGRRVEGEGGGGDPLRDGRG